eukprot:GEMP01093697.1.p1 GENE.GEMP01093697.1~~GEMP01093697.1.p1  ORF type:complete len:102 (+),score=21.65 GEMP01093697.1:48-308(+)
MSAVDAKMALRSFKDCVKEGGYAKCTSEATTAVNATGKVVARECDALAQDFFQCFNHRFNLHTCTPDVTAKLLRCHTQVSTQVQAE